LWVSHHNPLEQKKDEKGWRASEQKRRRGERGWSFKVMRRAKAIKLKGHDGQFKRRIRRREEDEKG
jgi:hypothetical protein